MPAKLWLFRPFSKPQITVCIPTYNGASFVDRALRSAQGQTFRRLKILVSIDKSTDATADLCRSFARDDPRIEVLEQRERLGWCANVNALLERVDTPFFFLYFHDDIILPQYCEHLHRALLGRPDAASANCDLMDLGAVEDFKPGRAYEGSTAQRILTLWGVKDRGTPFRAMIRTNRVGPEYRMPLEEQASLAPGQTLQMRMVAAGPSVYVPETLYLRWQRKGGLTDGWGQLSYQRALDGWKADVDRVFKLVDRLVPDRSEREIIKFAQITFVLRALTWFSERDGIPLPTPFEIHPEAPARIDFGEAQMRFGAEISEWLMKMHSDLVQTAVT